MQRRSVVRRSSKEIRSQVQRKREKSEKGAPADIVNSLLQVGMLLVMGYLMLQAVPPATRSTTKSKNSIRKGNLGLDAMMMNGAEELMSEFKGQQHNTKPKYTEHIPRPVVGEMDVTKYHVIFSTGCSTFQDWQSYIFFYHAWQSGQPGQVTRIASGCNQQDAKILQDLFEKEIKPMQPGRFHLHLTPDFARSAKPGIDFKYFNKPFGVRHWMQNALGYPDKAHVHDDTIIILLDPDQIIIRPITKYFEHSVEAWRPRGRSKVPIYQSVEHGQPFGQQYGFGMQWKTKVDINHVCNCTNSRISTMDPAEMQAHYSLGPPYIATGRDMYAIATKWTEFVVRIHDDYPHLLAEMFGYCFAAAHLNLPHRVAHSFMISDPGVGGKYSV